MPGSVMPANVARTLTQLAAALLLATPFFVAASPQSAEGIYSAAQAAQGKEVYSASCASCHAADLSGAVSRRRESVMLYER